MDWYQVTVEFRSVDSEGMRYTDKTTDRVVAKSAHMACLLVGAEFWADETDNIIRVYAALETS